MKTLISFVATLLVACGSTKPMVEKNVSPVPEPVTFSTDFSTHKVVTADQLQWTALNPARGDASPQAATIWGDRGQDVPTGFLVKFVDGFSSPPHIHNVSYRGVVIEGLVHNDDPNAAPMWMGPGSFWTQPAGESHITSASSATNIAFIEIDSGPYLVKPVAEAFDNGERPINIDRRNLVWRPMSDGPAQTSLLWGGNSSGDQRGIFVKLPAGFDGVIRSNGSYLKAIVATGNLSYRDGEALKELKPGSFFSSDVKHAAHAVKATEDSIVYVRSDQELSLFPAK